MAERPELRLVREHLESMLSPALAASALFEALGVSGGRMPNSAKQTAALVDGPLRAVLSQRLRRGEADALVDDVMAALAPAVTAEAKTPQLAARGDVTLEVPLSMAGEAVRLVVMAADDQFAVQIEGALGSSRVAAVTLRTGLALTRIIQIPVTSPEIVVIDASRFPAVEPPELARALASVAETVPRVVWGADLPYGGALMREIAAQNGRATSFDRSEGVEPILDLVRSRLGRGTGA